MSITPSTTPARRDIDGMAVIGQTRHALMGIRYEEGEGGADPATPAAASAAKATADKAAADAATPAAAKPPWGDDPTKFDPDKAWKLIQNVKGDLEAEKTKRAADIEAATKKAAEQGAKDALANFAKLLAGDEPVETDPVKLQEKVTTLSSQVSEANSNLTKAQADLKAANLSTAVAIHAPSLGANAALLLTNEQFKNSIASVEPTDEAALKAAITKAVQDTPTLKATPSRSGGGEHQGATVQSLEAQLAKATEARDFKETIRLKRAIAAARA